MITASVHDMRQYLEHVCLSFSLFSLCLSNLFHFLFILQVTVLPAAMGGSLEVEEIFEFGDKAAAVNLLSSGLAVGAFFFRRWCYVPVILLYSGDGVKCRLYCCIQKMVLCAGYTAVFGRWCYVPVILLYSEDGVKCRLYCCIQKMV